ncbi:MAG: molybdopterin-dependent oxidoreductase [Verrucomicrobia bacterium]|nr:molybdopterin-dependent oxidoreductase [Verrucomicrobiota bacterium]
MTASTVDPQQALAPQKRDDFYRLTVAGLVSRTFQFSLEDLNFNFAEKAFKPIGVGRGHPEGESTWTGCLLNELIDFVAASGQARHIEFVHWLLGQENSQPQRLTCSIPITTLEQEEVGLVWGQNGEFLSSEQGGPLVALLPSSGGYQQLSGVSRINLVLLPSVTTWASATQGVTV